MSLRLRTQISFVLQTYKRCLESYSYKENTYTKKKLFRYQFLVNEMVANYDKNSYQIKF